MRLPVQQAVAAVFTFSLLRWAAALTLLGRALWFLAAGRLYRAAVDFCWILRVSRVPPAMAAARRVLNSLLQTATRTGRNPIRDSYLSDPASAACAALFTVSGGGPHDLFRDVIVLKGATELERGVILLKYGRTFEAVTAIFDDVHRLMQRYTVVLEPCWAGYCDPSILMLVQSGEPVVVQCFTEEDHRFITGTGTPLVPVRLGPADWVDVTLFRPPADARKDYDLVMVANWARHKRHARLFRALATIPDRRIRVLLIGFPWGGRTAADIRREASCLGPNVSLDIVERIPAEEVAERVGRCKVFVFLSKKEGDNKALVEAMFANVPAIVFDRSVGGATTRVNAATGMLVSDRDLAAAITHMLDHHLDFTPRAWALEHTGSAVATAVLDAAIRRATIDAGRPYTHGIVQKTNSPNLAYKDERDRARFQADYDFLLACRRLTVPSVAKAVA